MVELSCFWVQGTLLVFELCERYCVWAPVHFGTACVEIDVKHGIILITWVVQTKKSLDLHVPR